MMMMIIIIIIIIIIIKELLLYKQNVIVGPRGWVMYGTGLAQYGVSDILVRIQET
jgi:hypothetical protein